MGGLVFLLLPMAQSYPQRQAYGLGGAVFRFADRLNLDYNELPSLQVAFAVTAAIVYGRRCGWLGKTLFGLWAVTVTLSALLMHEHHLLDLGAGAVLGWVAVATVHRRTSEERVLEVLRIEGLCLRELAHFVRRHFRNLRPLGAYFRASRGGWRKTRVLRASWCLAQYVDDVLQGRRRVKGDPEEHVQAILRALRGEAPFGGSAAEQLAQFVASAGEESRRELIDLFGRPLADPWAVGAGVY
jgi:hypothetical protein